MANVSNPYTFTITANKTVSCVISANIPTNETVLKSFNAFDNQFNIVTPKNITKIAFYCEEAYQYFVVQITPNSTYTIVPDEWVDGDVEGYMISNGGFYMKKTDGQEIYWFLDEGYGSSVIGADFTFKILYGQPIESRNVDYILTY